MRSLHVVLAWIVVASCGVTGFWAALCHWRESLRTSALMPAIYASWVLVVSQVTVGVIVLQSGIEAGGLHYFYGFLGMASITIIYSYRPQVEQWQYLLLGLGNLFIMGLSLRAVFLNQPIPV